MKKIFLFTSALLVSATMMAQLVGWSAVELSNETAAGTSTVNRLYTNGQGDVFFLGNSASNGEKPTISFDGITLDAAPYRVNKSRTNMNVVFGKLSGKDASTQWVRRKRPRGIHQLCGNAYRRRQIRYGSYSQPYRQQLFGRRSGNGF